jgi:hypothetical protein
LKLLHDDVQRSSLWHSTTLQFWLFCSYVTHDEAKPTLSAHALAYFPSASQAAKQKSISFYQTGRNPNSVANSVTLLTQNNNKVKGKFEGVS